MRLTAAMTRKHAALLECFVDDPLMAFGGNRDKRKHVMAMIVVLWFAFGYRLAWKKGARCQNVQWIGAMFNQWCSPTGVHGLSVTITPDKFEEMRPWCTELSSAEKVYKNDPSQFAGLVTWITGILPMLAVYTSMLWAALAVATTNVVDRSASIRPLKKWLDR